MLTLEEIQKKGIQIVGMGKKSDFVVSAKFEKDADSNVWITNNFQTLLNENLKISDYSEKAIQHLIFECLILPPYDGKGVNWIERKYFKRKEHKFFIDIRFPDYQRFCNATKQEAMKIMAEQTLRGTEKFLSTVKDFDYPKFYTDLKALFVKEGIL